MAIPADLCERLRPILEGLCALDLSGTDLGAYLEHKTARAGETLWKEGDESAYAAFVLEGKLEILKNTEFAGSRFVLGVVGPGSIAGETCLLNHRPRAVTASVVEDAELLLLTLDGLNRLLDENPRAGAEVLRALLGVAAGRLGQAYDRLAKIF